MERARRTRFVSSVGTPGVEQIRMSAVAVGGRTLKDRVSWRDIAWKRDARSW